jgi:hypothetical protein
MVNSNIVVSFHHKMAMKHCVEDDEIEKQLKCKICGMGLFPITQRQDSVTGHGG